MAGIAVLPSMIASVYIFTLFHKYDNYPRFEGDQTLQTIEPTLVYIAGPGRSGSTMLDMLLGGSDYINSLGEVHRLNRYAQNGTEVCTCGAPVARCSFWSRVEQKVLSQYTKLPEPQPLAELEMMVKTGECNVYQDLLERCVLVLGSQKLFNFWFRYLAPTQHRNAAINSFLWFDAIRRASGRPVCVDSSKDARRLGLLYFYSRMIGSRMKTIFLVRDGRGVSASAMRREGISMETAARHWSGVIRKTKLVLRSISPRDYCVVRYEDLCTDPEREIERVCEFVGVPYSLCMLHLGKEEAHIIGGNPMRFRKGETSISLDEKWKTTLSAGDLATFREVAGGEAQSLGYSL